MLGGGLLSPGSIDAVQLVKSRLCPDAESSNVATRGNLEKVQSVNAQKGDTRDVTEGSGNTVILVVNDEWATTLDSAAIPHLTLTSTETTGALDLKWRCKLFTSHTLRDQTQTANAKVK